MSLSPLPLGSLQPAQPYIPLDLDCMADLVHQNECASTLGKPLRAQMMHLLAGSLVLYLNYRHYARTAEDSAVPELRDLFEAYAESEKDYFDLLSEHLGDASADSDVMLEETCRLSQIQQSPEHDSLFNQMAEACNNSRRWAEEIRIAMRVAQEDREPVILALLAEALRGHETRIKYLSRLVQRSRA